MAKISKHNPNKERKSDDIKKGWVKLIMRRHTISIYYLLWVFHDLVRGEFGRKTAKKLFFTR